MRKPIILVMLFSFMIACKTTYKPVFYKLSDFNIVAGNQFIPQIAALSSIQKISIVDTNRKENQFKVNEVTVFNDTLHKEQPNSRSYSKYAEVLNSNKDKLKEVLTTFEQCQVSEFIREKNFYLFPVEKYALAKQTGYLYTQYTALKVNDTLATEEVFGKKIVLKKSVDSHWFEYESVK